MISKRTSSDGLRIAVIGGGIGGLTTALSLLKHGHRPVVMEASDQVGGLGGAFEYDGVRIDRFYHVILDSDVELQTLITEVGLEKDLLWRRTGMGFYLGGALYPFNTPLDLLRFGALSPLARLRTGLGAFYLTQVIRRGIRLDGILARDWLTAIFGRSLFDRIWAPLLHAKFGGWQNLPAYCVWNRLRREKNGRPEIKGYLRGGYQTLANRLRDLIVLCGGDVRVGTPISSVAATGDSATIETASGREHFDAAVSTLPLPLLARIARPDLAAALPLPDLRYQGVVNALVVSKQPLDRFYWTIVIDPRFPFQGVVETTHVIPPGWVGDRHLIYMMNYCDAASETYGRSDETVRHQALQGLQALYPRYDLNAVEGVHVFRTPHVEPAWTLGYLGQRPAPRVGWTRLYLSTTAQAYPWVNSWNTSIAVARETVGTLLADLGGVAQSGEWKSAAAA